LILKRYHGQLTEMGAAIVAECDKSNAEKIAFATKRAQLDAETTANATERAQLVADKLAMATDQTFLLQFYNTIVAREIAVVEHENAQSAQRNNYLVDLGSVVLHARALVRYCEAYSNIID
jgi:hypothetical protein